MEPPDQFLYVFGPVPSRRLGSSLGVDLMPHKTCTLDCVYCECGPTTRLTTGREAFADPGRVLEEVARRLDQVPDVDFVTFSGSGEPTLSTSLAPVAEGIRKNHPDVRLALLSNATLFDRPEVREACAGLDVVKASLDAVSAEAFRAVNRPAKGLSPERMVEGLLRFRENFSGRLWMEFFLVPGINDSDSELRAVAEAVAKIRPEQVMVNSLDRPGALSWVRPASPEDVARAVKAIPFAVPIGGPSKKTQREAGGGIPERILETIRRRPCTAADLARMLGIDENEVEGYLDRLTQSARVTRMTFPRGVFYQAREGEDR